MKALRSDRNMVLTAVSQDGRALEYAPEELKLDKTIVLTAVRSNGYGCRDARALEVISKCGFRAIGTVFSDPFVELNDRSSDRPYGS